MRRFTLFVATLLAAVVVVAQENEPVGEYAFKEMASRKGDTLQVEPLVVTPSSMSKMEVIYHQTDFRICEGDLIAGVTFKGYNPGQEQVRHLTVWLKNDNSTGFPYDFFSTDKMTKVFDGDCKILSGGTKDKPEDILHIAFDTPLSYLNGYNLRMVIMSQGVASGDSVLFLQSRGIMAASVYATTGQNGQLGEPSRSVMPFAVFTIATPVKYVSGTVTDEDAKGVAGATVKLRGMQWEETIYEGVTDSEGKYRIRIEEGNKTYAPSATAPGHTCFSNVSDFSVKENPTKDFTLYGSVTYPANQQSSIILPVAPDATVGRYYRLARREGKKFIFERERSPQANVPYVLFADRDYKVDLSGMDLTITPGRTKADDMLSLVGSYRNGDNVYANYIDRDLDTHSNTGRAMHAHLYGHYSLLLNGDYELVFVDSDTTAEKGYRPIVEEGKRWTYDNYMPARPAMYDHYYYYNLRGDTLIAGQQCLKMYSENRMNSGEISYTGALYEVNKKVYYFSSGKEEAELLYDFDCVTGDTLHVRAGQLVVKDIQTEDNGGIAIKRYTLYEVTDDYDERYDFSWIEGVGASKDFFSMIPLGGNYNTLNACELNGETLYKKIEPDYTEAGYHKMGIEGKRWNYIHYHLEDDGWHKDPYSYVVKGDTIIRRTSYKKLYYQDEQTERFECLLFETGRTVYKNTDLGNNSYDSPLLTSFFEFDRNDFGRVFTWKAEMDAGNTNWMVYGVDTIEVNNRQFRRYTCLQKYSEDGETLTTIDYDGEGVWHDIWVEGVGSASSGIEDQHPSHEPPVRAPGEYTAFVSCYENGECIFTADDFDVQTSTKPVDAIAYRPFVEDGKVWKVGNTQTILDNSVQVVDYYYFGGDTIIDGKTCKQMMYQRYVSPDYSNEYWTPTPSLSKVGAWYEEDQKVYFYDERKQAMVLKYDFSIAPNDTLQFLTDWSSPFIIGSKQTGGIEGFKGVYRDIRMCGDDGQSYHDTFWLEGVGCLRGPISSPCNPILGDPVPEFLMSCTVGDDVIYLNDDCEDGATPEGARKNRFDFTHTIKIKPKARRSQEELSIYGEYNDRQLGIHLDALDDAYLVSIAAESGKVVYEKTVNAGNIVGLSIDISAYAMGRYTVTIENSSESFTGEFEAQATGIKENVRIEKSKNVSIYNLHGQRLSSLHKGLNIVNGQKISVK